MIPIKKRSDKEIEIDRLTYHLEFSMEMINENFPSFHAFITKSGEIPQLRIKEK